MSKNKNNLPSEQNNPHVTESIYYFQIIRNDLPFILLEVVIQIALEAIIPDALGFNRHPYYILYFTILGSIFLEIQNLFYFKRTHKNTAPSLFRSFIIPEN